MLLSDNHVHTNFSSDSDTPMEAMLLQAQKIGLSSICFTDHIDYGFPAEKYHMDFVFPMEDYFAKVSKLSKQFPSLPIRTGVELGLKEDILPLAVSLTDKHDFDFVIGSTHLVDNIDPYYEEYWDAYGEEGGIQHYYEVTYENICNTFDFDVYGHIDYVIRYCPTIKKSRKAGQINEAFYQSSVQKNKELIDEILLTLIQKNRGIEINTGGLKYGLGHPNPNEDILKRYHTLGGTIVTVGSDAHETKYLGYCFDKLPSLLWNCGFRSYFEFHKRKAVPISLS